MRNCTVQLYVLSCAVLCCAVLPCVLFQSTLGLLHRAKARQSPDPADAPPPRRIRAELNCTRLMESCEKKIGSCGILQAEDAEDVSCVEDVSQLLRWGNTGEGM